MSRREVRALLEQTAPNTINAVLQAVRRNDPATTDVIACDLFTDYGRELGQALVGNTHVSVLRLDLSTLLLVWREDALTKLLEYVRTGPALRNLEIYQRALLGSDQRALLGYDQARVVVGSDTHGTGNSILYAAASHRHLKELTLDFWPTSVDALCHFLRDTKCLQRLTCVVPPIPDVVSMERLSLAMGSNQTLWSIHIDTLDRMGFADLFLGRLSKHAFLKKLFFESHPIHENSFDSLPSLRQLLQCTTSQLRVLQLSACAFDSRAIEDLALGLSSNTRLERLIFHNCHFDSQALNAFLELTQRSMEGSKLRELGFEQSTRVMSYQSRFGPKAIGKFAIRVLSPNADRTNLGCLLQKFSLSVPYDRHFFAEYAAQAATIRLCHLELPHFYGRSWRPMARHLQSIVHLRELTISPEMASAVSLSRILRHNGSLLYVHIPKVRPRNTPADPTETRLYEAFLSRNRYVAQWWTNPEGQPCPDEEQELHRLLFPLVALAVRPAYAMAPNMILAGLLAVGNKESMGPSCGKGSTTSLSGNSRLLS